MVLYKLSLAATVRQLLLYHIKGKPRFHGIKHRLTLLITGHSLYRTHQLLELGINDINLPVCILQDVSRSQIRNLQTIFLIHVLPYLSKAELTHVSLYLFKGSILTAYDTSLFQHRINTPAVKAGKSRQSVCRIREQTVMQLYFFQKGGN